MGIIVFMAMAIAMVMAVVLPLVFSHREQKVSKVSKKVANATNEEQKLTLNNGAILSSEEVLALDSEKLRKLSKVDIQQVVNYAGHRIVDVVGEEERNRWRSFYELASAALYGYL